MTNLREYGRLNLLTALIWGEGRGERIEGKLAIGCCVRNRVNDKRWPNTYEEVILQDKQFSCFNLEDQNHHSVLNALLPSQKWKDPVWRECRWAAYAVIDNWVRDVTHGANHYNTTGCDPAWDDDMVLTVVIGGHEFFRS